MPWHASWYMRYRHFWQESLRRLESYLEELQLKRRNDDHENRDR